MNFRKEDIQKISEFLGVDCENYQDLHIWKIIDKNLKNQIFLTISESDKKFETIENIVNIQTSQGFFEIHNCNNYSIFPPDEIFFVSENGGTISCLIVGKNATCSLFANIDTNILDQDITDLPQPVLLAAMQLSLIRNMQ